MAASKDLSESLSELSRLLTEGRHLDETVTSVAEFAVRAVPCADGAAVAVNHHGGAPTIGTSALFVQGIEHLQFTLQEGPCISAVADRTPQVSGSLGGEQRWRRFGPRVSRLGVHSVLAVPLSLPDRVLGSLSLYARSKDAFGDEAVNVAERFAIPAAVTAANAQVLAQAQRAVGQLTEALTSRATIDQAIGILMTRTGASPREAFERLRDMSQAEHIKVADLAHQIVDEAVRRARGRQARSDAPQPPADRR